MSGTCKVLSCFCGGRLKESVMGYLIGGIYISAFISLAAWITHIVVSIQASAWLFMIVGALIPPVAVVHGVASWWGYGTHDVARRKRILHS